MNIRKLILKLDDIDLFITCNDYDIKNNIDDLNESINLDKKKKSNIK